MNNLNPLYENASKTLRGAFSGAFVGVPKRLPGKPIVNNVKQQVKFPIKPFSPRTVSKKPQINGAATGVGIPMI